MRSATYPRLVVQGAPRLAAPLPLARLVGLVSLLSLTACGRRATAEDCGVIVDRYVEIELLTLKVTDPKIIEARKAEMRRDLKDDLKACPGKRITDGMLACVRKAQTNEELDKCTRF
jgi:hypothetical protein